MPLYDQKGNRNNYPSVFLVILKTWCQNFCQKVSLLPSFKNSKAQSKKN